MKTTDTKNICGWHGMADAVMDELQNIAEALNGKVPDDKSLKAATRKLQKAHFSLRLAVTWHSHSCALCAHGVDRFGAHFYPYNFGDSVRYVAAVLAGLKFLRSLPVIEPQLADDLHVSQFALASSGVVVSIESAVRILELERDAV